MPAVFCSGVRPLAFRPFAGECALRRVLVCSVVRPLASVRLVWSLSLSALPVCSGIRYLASGLRSFLHVVVTGLLVFADERHFCFDRSIRGAVIAKVFQNALTQFLLPHAPAGLLLGCLANGVCRVWFRPVTERPA